MLVGYEAVSVFIGNRKGPASKGSSQGSEERCHNKLKELISEG